MKKKFASIFDFLVSGTCAVFLLVGMSFSIVCAKGSGGYDSYLNGFDSFDGFDGIYSVVALSQILLLIVILAIGALITLAILDAFGVCKVMHDLVKSGKAAVLNRIGVLVLAILTVTAFVFALIFAIQNKYVVVGFGCIFQMIIGVSAWLVLQFFHKPLKKAIFGETETKKNVVDAEAKEL